MPEQKSASVMQEYYIRKEGDEDSRGPFTLEQLSSLVEAGQVDRQTFYYDSLAEKWVEVQSNPELVTALFPLKKKLSMRPKETVPTVNVRPADENKPITVEDMLAAAEGRTEDTKGKQDLSDVEARAAHWGMRLLSVILLISSAGLMMSNMETVITLDFASMVTNPLVVFGVVDLLLCIVLFLEVTTMYGFVRLRAAIGCGFFLFYFWTATGGNMPGLVATFVGSAAMFALTLVADLRAVITLGILGLAGTGAFAYLLSQ